MLKKIWLSCFILSSMAVYSQSAHKIYINSFYKSYDVMGPILQMDWAIQNELKQNPDSKQPIKLYVGNWKNRYLFQSLLQDTICDSAQMEQLFFKLETKFETMNSEQFELWKNFFRWQNKLPLDVKKRLEFMGTKNFCFLNPAESDIYDVSFGEVGVNWFINYLDQFKEKGFQTQIQYDALKAYNVNSEKHLKSATNSFEPIEIYNILNEYIDTVYSELKTNFNWKQEKEFAILKDVLYTYVKLDVYIEQENFSSASILDLPKLLDSVSRTSNIYLISASNFFQIDSNQLVLMNAIPNYVKRKFSKELGYNYLLSSTEQIKNNLTTMPFVFKYLGMDKKVECLQFIDSLEIKNLKLHTDTTTSGIMDGYQFYQKLNIPIHVCNYMRFFKQYQFSGELSIDTLIETAGDDGVVNDSAAPVSEDLELNVIKYNILASAGVTTQYIKQQEINTFLSQNNLGKLDAIHSAVLEVNFGKGQGAVFGQSIALGQTSNFKSYFFQFTTALPIFNRNWFGWDAMILVGHQNYTLTIPGNFAMADITKSNPMLQYKRTSFIGGLGTRLNLNVLPQKIGFKVFAEAGGILDCNTDRRWQLNGQMVNAIIGNFNGSSFYVKGGITVGLYKKKYQSVRFD